MKYGIEGKNVLLGVCGGIAAYKTVELLRGLTKRGARVRVVMTENACWFVGPLTFQALSGLAVCRGLFEESGDASIRHIEWAGQADVAVIAPATANMIGKLACGIADDALSTFMMAVTAPRIVCPAMNTHMYEQRAVQRNLDTLEADGWHIVEPGAGELACGTVGPGRLADPETILDRIAGVLTPKDLLGKKVLVTAGPTREPLDPVRFISNPSSGKMGFALARAAEHRGASVVLVSGPVVLPDPANVTVVRVNTAGEMADAVLSRAGQFDVIIKSAAVSDFRPKKTSPHKVKKEEGSLLVEFERTLDILKSLGGSKGEQILVGFAAETRDLDRNAGKKLAEKNLDLIVGNIVGKEGSGFASDSNQVVVYRRNKPPEPLEPMEKEAVAHAVLDRVVGLIRGES